VNLQELCAARGLTLEQLAARAGVALATLTKMDAGTVRANQFIVHRLADALGLTPAALQDEFSAARRIRGRTSTKGGLGGWR
jgi:transcriptional regulator with XRE-family HTH domain